MEFSREDQPDPVTDRLAYSREALARLVVCRELQSLAAYATTAVPTNWDADSKPGDLVADAVLLVDSATELLTAAVIAERAKGTSWTAIGRELGGVTRQAAHERYQLACADWELALLEPHAPGGGLRLHEAAYEPTKFGRYLDQWAREHADEDHTADNLVTGYLSPLTADDELAQTSAVIEHAQRAGAEPAVRAALHEHKATVLERIAAQGGRPEAAVQAAEARALAAALRAETTTTTHSQENQA